MGSERNSEDRNSLQQAHPADLDETVIPLYKEEAAVSKRQVMTGRVQVSTVTRQREELVEELVSRDRIDVQRIPIGRPVQVIPEIRQEGDTTIVPLVEEEIVIQRRLVLKEEVHIRRVGETEKFQERVMLRTQEAEITRLPGELPIPEESAIGAKIS